MPRSTVSGYRSDRAAAEQLARRDAERSGNPGCAGDTQLEFSVLDPRNRHPVQAARRCQVILGEPGRGPEFPDPGPERD